MSYFEHELVVDNFAGGGGASTGIEWALRRPVDLAFNHDRKALGMHSINHPFTEHHITDVFDVEPAVVTKGRRVGFGHFSPDCTDHSKAKNGVPLRKRIRALCLVMLRWADIGTRVMTMENVEEIKDWCPLMQIWVNGKPEWHRDLRHKGRCWQGFLACLGGGIDPQHGDLPEFLTILCGDEEAEDVKKDAARVAAILAKKEVWRAKLVAGFGYVCEAREIKGYSHGSPTIRKRLFMVCRCDGRPIVWPAATHAEPKKLQDGQQRWRTIAECLDFTLACPSIFLTAKQAKKWKCRRPLASNTLRRIAVGVGRHVIHADEPFIVNTTNGEFHGAPSRVRNCDGPLGTQTGTQKYALVERATAPFITEHANASTQRNMPADEPGRTQCSEVKGGHFALVASSMVQVGYSEREGQAPRVAGLQQPGWTNVGGAAKAALTAVSTVKMRGRNIGSAVTEPGRTASAGGEHHGLVATALVGAGGPSYSGKPRSVTQPHGSQTTENHMAMMAASLVREFGESVGQGVDSAGPTVMATGQGKTGLVASSLAVYNKSGSVGQSTGRPLRTQTTLARMGYLESHAAAPPLSPKHLAGARRVAAFLRSFGVAFEGEFATVRGHVIWDIGMRMLTPRELYRAQGFGEDYVIDRAWVVDPQTGETHEVRLTKTEQIRFVGNSVCPQVMEALVRANVPELIVPHPPPKWRPSLELMKQAGLAA